MRKVACYPAPWPPFDVCQHEAGPAWYFDTKPFLEAFTQHQLKYQIVSHLSSRSSDYIVNNDAKLYA